MSKSNKGTENIQYKLTNHLGNVRVTFDENGTVLQEDSYYPFGMTMGGLSFTNVPDDEKNLYLYNGKELQEDFGLDWHDYGARFYDAQICRWHMPDPLEQFYSAYVYAANNPINIIDPSGEWASGFQDGYTVDKTGNVKRVDDTGGDKYDVLYTEEDYKKAKASGKTNEYGNPEPENQVRINDTDILPSLEKDRSDFSGNYAISTDKKETFNVFWFMANNTNVEWGIDGYRTSGDNEYIIRTSHDDEAVTMSTSLSKYAEFNQIFNIHVHPAVDGTKGGSECTVFGGDMCNVIDMYYRFKRAGMKRTDTWFKKDGQWTVFPKHYVYHKHSKVLYNYTPWKNNVYIRKINKASDMFRDLGF